LCPVIYAQNQGNDYEDSTKPAENFSEFLHIDFSIKNVVRIIARIKEGKQGKKRGQK